MVKTVTPMIHVPDVRATIEWYQSIGFALVGTDEEYGDLHWAVLSFGDSEVMFNAGGRHTGNPESSVRRSVGKEDAYRLIRTCCSSLKEAGDLLDAEPSLLDERTGLWETPLHYLAVEDEVDAVRFLHLRGASLGVRNDFGDSPLSEALSLGHKGTAAYC